MSRSHDDLAPHDQDPPREPLGVRTDRLEHPDPDALAAAQRPTDDGETAVAPLEDPPREHELANIAGGERTATGGHGENGGDDDSPALDADPPHESG